jgi:hypothetical protein
MDVGEFIQGVPVNGSLPATWDPADPCANATPPIEHSHTFWENGSFNSYDQNGQQVDEGSYTIVDDHTFTIDGRTPMTFHYRIHDADDHVRCGATERLFDEALPQCPRVGVLGGLPRPDVDASDLRSRGPTGVGLRRMRRRSVGAGVDSRGQTFATAPAASARWSCLPAW